MLTQVVGMSNVELYAAAAAEMRCSWNWIDPWQVGECMWSTRVAGL